MLPLSRFILGNRRTALRTGEMVTAIHVPKTSAGGASAFVKLGARRYLVISIAMAAARIRLGADGTIAEAAIAVGSCSAVAQRLGALEATLAGVRAQPAEIAAAIASAGLAELAPIDDVRASADYRGEAAGEIVRRAILRASAATAGARAAA
jgi:CO/xanthine dehydrogenase FAD-binding subunit